ncbi:conserved hypothetical protein [Rickettsiella grylli]|uniref:YicC family protein n=2 Tax=Rickettsiella grylli TaxID=59196 RepID=A8PL50_9COXI|nr:conserved hypothetical protein [Rickettsiella grylli]
MINSMTAFAKKEKHAEWGQAAWEIRSVNHRYLDIILSLPDNFSHLEPLIRKQMQKNVHRGRVDIKLHYKPYPNKAIPITIDKPLAQSLINAYKEIAQLSQSKRAFNPGELLRWPHLLQFPELQPHEIQTELMALLTDTLNNFCNVRQTEGHAIFGVLNRRILKLIHCIKYIQTQLPQLLNRQREKISARLQEIKASLDANRLEQEMLLFAQKTDVAEELDRLTIHLTEFKNLLIKNQVHGKQLDFLLQELNREANTLAAKSFNAELTLSAVNIKVLIEEMREQVQNIE